MLPPGKGDRRDQGAKNRGQHAKYSKETASSTSRNIWKGKPSIGAFLDSGLNDVPFEEGKSIYKEAEHKMLKLSRDVSNLINELEMNETVKKGELNESHDKVETQ